MLGLDHVRVGEPRDAGVLVKRDSGLPEISSQQRVRAHVAGDLADAFEQPPIIERRFAGGDAVARELGGFADQPGGWSVRTGTGPSLAAIPPNSSRVTSAVRAPSRAARSAATTPAGPAPITTTSRLVAPDEVMETSLRVGVASGVLRFG